LVRTLFFWSRRRHTLFSRDWSSDVCSSDLGVDAAILFSDILVVPEAMGMEVQLIEKLGPLLPQPIKTTQDLNRICVPDVHDRLHYVFDAIKLIKKELNGRVPLIGFAGAPCTLLSY